ncbi:MAG TPA: hypothetical protein VHR66_15360 [Gemmataceae bacterium]|jgi:hypothetical protein|nr:hypothetical protein [Gemmataceae bacterium]
MYSVIWTKFALDQLAEVYIGLDLDHQDRLASSIEAINRRLAREPVNEGESRDADKRITFVDGHAVLFRVITTSQVVRVVEMLARSR